MDQCNLGEKIFSDALHGKALYNHTYQTLESILDDDACQSHCYLDDDCISYNYDEQHQVCNLSDADHTGYPEHLVDTPRVLYRYLENHVYPKSCKEILDKTGTTENRGYYIILDGKPVKIYCHMTSDICNNTSGWTLVMKIAAKSEFSYDSPFWTNQEPHNITAGQTGFDNHQTKMPSYWAMPFEKLCVGMKVNNVLKWIVIPYKANSLYDVIADGSYRPTNVSKATWMSLIGGSSLQPNCNQEGFNVGNDYFKARLGLIANNQNDCESPDSAIGFGLKSSKSKKAICGYYYYCYQGPCNIYIKQDAFGYIMIQ